MTRKRRDWKFRDFSLEFGPSTLIVGILNLTPDSFSGDGIYSDPDAAVQRALEIQEQGSARIGVDRRNHRVSVPPDATQLSGKPFDVSTLHPRSAGHIATE